MSIHELPPKKMPKTGGFLEKFVMHGVEGAEPETKTAENADSDWFAKKADELAEIAVRADVKGRPDAPQAFAKAKKHLQTMQSRGMDTSRWNDMLQ